MVAILDDKSAAIEYLSKELYENLNAINYLRSTDAKACVYNNDSNNGIIVWHEGESNFLATKNPQFLSEWWDMLPVGHHVFSGVPSEVADVFLLEREPTWMNPCKVYALKGEFCHEVKSEHKCERLTPEDAGEVDEHYTYRHDDSLEWLRNDIINRDSSCVRINGELAAWCLVHGGDESLGPLYTKEKFRRQGLAELVSTDLIKKLIEKKHIPYVQIVENNHSSLGLIAKFGGMQYTHRCIWFGVDKLTAN